MTTHKEALKLALDLATMHHTDDGYAELRSKVRQLAKEALAQTEQEPDDGYCKACDGWKCTSKAGCVALDNPTPQRKPLTDTERDSMVDSYDSGLMEKFWYLKGIDDTEAAHGIKEKNT